jgi:diguanylate cyclase (GGDEF)-like protein
MHFDTPTLMMVGGITTAVSGVLLFGIWLQLRRATALLWWIAADMTSAAGILALTFGLPGGIFPLVAAGTLLSDLAVALLWVGVRVFDRRPTPLRMALPIIAAWMAADLIAGMVLKGPVFGFAGWAGWLLLSTFELWRGRAERIPARWPLMVLLVVHAFVYSGGIYDTLTGSLPTSGMAPLHSWFGAIFFESIFFAMASAIAMAMLCKERETQEFMHAARSDSLTGIANHGALMESARRIYERCRNSSTPYSLIMFDLDHFKAINDRHGHRAGDEILRAFADTVHNSLRPTDLFGRYGGEEFTVALPGATIETAYVIAERVRHAFAERHRFRDGQPLNATVSAGVAEAGADTTFEAVIDAADRALYEAKNLGRDRVARAERQRPLGGQDSVIRVA